MLRHACDRILTTRRSSNKCPSIHAGHTDQTAKLKVLFNGAEKGIYTFNIRPGAGADEEDSFFSALEAQEIFESIPPPETSFEVEVRHDRFELRKAMQDDGPSSPV